LGVRLRRIRVNEAVDLLGKPSLDGGQTGVFGIAYGQPNAGVAQDAHVRPAGTMLDGQGDALQECDGIREVGKLDFAYQRVTLCSPPLCESSARPRLG
jgi:hypothetical protein